MKRLIAIVDDDESVREALASLMGSLGYDTAHYSSGDEFLRSAERHGTDCLIADVQMPGMTGPQLHDQLTIDGQRIPTILMTAYPDDAVRAKAMRAGVHYFLAKPFREDELLECVRSALQHPE